LLFRGAGILPSNRGQDAWTRKGAHALATTIRRIPGIGRKAPTLGGKTIRWGATIEIALLLGAKFFVARAEV
jgi:hypothetical protein